MYEMIKAHMTQNIPFAGHAFVTIDEIGPGHATAHIDDSPGPIRPLQFASLTHRDNAIPGHGHRAIGEDAPLGIDGDHATAPNQQIDFSRSILPHAAILLRRLNYATFSVGRKSKTSTSPFFYHSGTHRPIHTSSIYACISLPEKVSPEPPARPSFLSTRGTSRLFRASNLMTLNIPSGSPLTATIPSGGSFIFRGLDIGRSLPFFLRLHSPSNSHCLTSIWEYVVRRRSPP